VRRTWAPRGRPPVLVHPFNWKRASMAAALCYGVRGGGAQLCFHLHPGNYDSDTLIQVLSELRRFLGGEKATLLWDGLPAHRSAAMRAWIRQQRSWLVVERLPAYAPELNPVEALWSSLKAIELANSPRPPWPRGSPRPIGASSGSARPRIWSMRFCATPASRSHDRSTTSRKLVVRTRAANKSQGCR
jgi:DDE superfamily endonuclease